MPQMHFNIDDPFWNRITDLVRQEVIPYQWAALNDQVPGAAPSGCIRNFEIAAGRASGEHKGYVFQDSDLYKWLEAVAFSLEQHPDPDLESLADAAIELICAAQQPDGYINTYFCIVRPHARWRNMREAHELYCAGHMIEAAVAYFRVTGKRAILEAAIRFA
ncbi:MAG: glycoside hydrolase family 127 protein, partial [Symbiobacteriaceae bacterium]|nr:glycoside hydrolase family 127 protein [Symbiobacteriaceae bacterium]